MRDPLGVRPLSLGKLGDAWIIASETVAFDIIGAEFVRDVEPGEIVVISEDGIRSVKPFGCGRRASACSRYFYFSRPDSVLAGRRRLRGAQAHRRRAGAREPGRGPTR